VGVSQAGAILSIHMLQQNALHFSSSALLNNLGNELSFILLLKLFYLYVKVSLIKKIISVAEILYKCSYYFPLQQQINSCYFSKT
jgi:hypothetical protein